MGDLCRCFVWFLGGFFAFVFCKMDIYHGHAGFPPEMQNWPNIGKLILQFITLTN